MKEVLKGVQRRRNNLFEDAQRACIYVEDQIIDVEESCLGSRTEICEVIFRRLNENPPINIREVTTTVVSTCWYYQAVSSWWKNHYAPIHLNSILPATYSRIQWCINLRICTWVFQTELDLIVFINYYYFTFIIFFVSFILVIRLKRDKKSKPGHLINLLITRMPLSSTTK